jgi:hypothetical protein
VTENNASRTLYLVVEELAEVLHIHFTFIGIYHGGEAVNFAIGKISPLYGTNYVGQFTDTRRLY